MGFEPTRGNPIGLAGRRLNRSAKVSLSVCRERLQDAVRNGLSYLKVRKDSATGTRTRVARVRAEYPNQLDYSGVVNNIENNTRNITFVIGLRARRENAKGNDSRMVHMVRWLLWIK